VELHPQNLWKNMRIKDVAEELQGWNRL